MPALVVLGLLPWVFRHEAELFELRGFPDEYLACLERLEFGSLR